MHAAIDGDFDTLHKLVDTTEFQVTALHKALAAAIIKGHTDIISTLVRVKEIQVSLFNNAALKWAMAEKNNRAIDLLTSHPSFTFGSHTPILMTAVMENCPKVVKLALQSSTLKVTADELSQCLKKAAKMEYVDVMIVILEDSRTKITSNDLRNYLDEDVPAEDRNKFFQAIMNNPSVDDPGAIVRGGFTKSATPEMAQLAYFYDPESREEDVLDEVFNKDDFALFKLCCGKSATQAAMRSIFKQKHDWLRYMVEQKMITSEVREALEEALTYAPEAVAILGPK